MKLAAKLVPNTTDKVDGSVTDAAVEVFSLHQKMSIRGTQFVEASVK